MATANTSVTSSSGEFVTVPGDRRSEVARTLAEPVPQALSLLDQFGLWGNLGVSLLGFTGAIFVLQPDGAGTPELSLAAALTAIVVGHPARHGAARPGRAARRADRRARHGAAARAVRRPAVLPADRAQHPAVPRLGDLRAGDDRHRRPHPDARPAQVGLRPDRGAGHRPADDPAARRDPGAAPLRHHRGAGRAVLPARAAPQAPAAGVHARHLDRLLGGDRHRGRRRGLVRAADRRLQPALAQPARRLRRDAGRLQRHPGAVLRHRAAGAGHRRARQPERHLRRVHRAAGRRALLRRPRRPGARPGVRQRLLHGGVGAEPAPAVGPPDPGRWRSPPSARRARCG